VVRETVVKELAEVFFRPYVSNGKDERNEVLSGCN